MSQNNKHLSLNDFKDMNIQKSYPVDKIEKAEHKQHKYLRKEGDKYIYDYDSMTSKDHEAAANHHKLKFDSLKNSIADDEDGTTHTGVKSKDHLDYHNELKNDHEKLAKKKKASETNDKINQKFSDEITGKNKKQDGGFESNINRYLDSIKGKENVAPIRKLMENFDLDSSQASRYVEKWKNNQPDSKDNKISKSEAFDILNVDSTIEKLEKAAHKNHKYLRIENGKYIYDLDKMTHADHEDASRTHEEMADEEEKLQGKASDRNNIREQQQRQKNVQYHQTLAKQHKMLHDEKKENKENISSDQLVKLAEDHKKLDTQSAHKFEITSNEIRVTVSKKSYSQIGDFKKFLEENNFKTKGKTEISSEAGPDYQVLIFTRA